MPPPAAPSGPPASPMRVLLVEDHTIVSTGVRMLLDTAPGLTVVGAATTIAEALALAAQTQPELILLDLDLGGESVAARIPALLQAAPATRIVVLIGVRDPEAQRQAVRHGAIGLVLKEDAPATLLQALATVHAGKMWLDPTMAAAVLRALTQPSPPASEAATMAPLTGREREVITLLGAGLPNKAIAARLG